MSEFLISLAIIAIVGCWGAAIYSRLVAARNTFRNSFAPVDVQLQRCFDLIPDLIEIAKTCMSHERETLEAVIAARSAAQSGLAAAKANPGDADAMARLAAAQEKLNAGRGRLLMVAEAYPDLSANRAMMQAAGELTSTEDKVAHARQAFNDSVMAYNTRRELFPSSILAGMFNFAAATPLAIPVERQARVRAVSNVQS